MLPPWQPWGFCGCAIRAGCAGGQGLPHPAQCLFLRLYQRRGPWFREATLEYPEVGPAAPAVALLQEVALLQPAATSHCAALVQVTGRPSAGDRSPWSR